MPSNGGSICVSVLMLLSVVSAQQNGSLSDYMFCISGCPVFDIDEHLIFRLYTPKNRYVHERLAAFAGRSTPMANFNPRLPTRIFIHGYLSDESMINLYRDAYLEKSDYNFIGADWLIGAGTFNYFKAKKRVRTVSGNHDISATTVIFIWNIFVSSLHFQP